MTDYNALIAEAEDLNAFCRKRKYDLLAGGFERLAAALREAASAIEARDAMLRECVEVIERLMERAPGRYGAADVSLTRARALLENDNG